MKKLLCLVILSITLCLSAFLASCTIKENPSGSSSSNEWGQVYTAEAAFVKAVSLGYTGSLEDFIATISGKDGEDGVGIKSISINKDGELIVTLSNTIEINLGSIKGEDGKDGADGQPGQDGNDGAPGQDGEDGVGIAKTEINSNGELVITYTDGTSINLGKIVGSDGENGEDGYDGQDGEDGQDGVGIKTAIIDEKGHLIITLSNNTVLDLGKVTGANGENGAPGQNGADGQPGQDGNDGQDGEDGVGIAKTEINSNGELVITYTDGTSVNLGKIVGNDGQDGEDGKDGADGEAVACEHVYEAWTVGKEATCTSIGYDTRVCSLCNFVEYRFIDEVGHSYGEFVDMIYNCDSHWQVAFCSICGDSQIRSAEPHKFVDGMCVDCGSVDEDMLAAYNGTYGYNFFATAANGTQKQALYDSIDDAVQTFHVDTSKDAGSDFVVATINYSSLGLSVDEAVSVWKTFRDDNPLYYWMSNTVAVDDVNLILYTSADYDEGAERKAYNALVYQQVEEYFSLINDGDTKYRTALGYHDFIVDAIDYAYNSENQPETAEWAHNIIGVMEKRGAVCEGYARTFQLLLNYSGIENVFVTGSGNGEEHAWNLVRLDDGEWYWCDLTWDDQGDSWMWGIIYNYFCVNDTENNIWLEGGWVSDKTADFLDTHSIDVSSGSGTDFLYDLPQRSISTFSADNMLNAEFSSGIYDCTVVGYNAVSVTNIRGDGNLVIPETLTYNGVTYTVICLGTDDADRIPDHHYSKNVTLMLPQTVKFIWDYTFDDDRIESIFVNENNPYFTSLDGVLFTKSLYTLIAYPAANSRAAYAIPDDTVYVAKDAFSCCYNLENLTIGKNTALFGYANWGSGFLDRAPVGGIINVVMGGLQGIISCDTSIFIHPENTYYYTDGIALYNGNKTTLYCILDRGISEFTLPASVEYIDDDDSLFTHYPRLQSIAVEEGNTQFSSYDGILYNKAMTEIIAVPGGISGHVDLSNNLTKIEAYSFSNKTITSITIPSSVTSIGNYAFSNCSSLISITYNGTMAEWKAISKGYDWDYGTPDYTVYCSDGNLDKNGNQI